MDKLTGVVTVTVETRMVRYMSNQWADLIARGWVTGWVTLEDLTATMIKETGSK